MANVKAAVGNSCVSFGSSEPILFCFILTLTLRPMPKCYIQVAQSIAQLSIANY